MWRGNIKIRPDLNLKIIHNLGYKYIRFMQNGSGPRRLGMNEDAVARGHHSPRHCSTLPPPPFLAVY